MDTDGSEIVEDAGGESPGYPAVEPDRVEKIALITLRILLAVPIGYMAFGMAATMLGPFMSLDDLLRSLVMAISGAAAVAWIMRERDTGRLLTVVFLMLGLCFFACWWSR